MLELLSPRSKRQLLLLGDLLSDDKEIDYKNFMQKTGAKLSEIKHDVRLLRANYYDIELGFRKDQIILASDINYKDIATDIIVEASAYQLLFSILFEDHKTVEHLSLAIRQSESTIYRILPSIESYLENDYKTLSLARSPFRVVGDEEELRLLMARVLYQTNRADDFFTSRRIIDKTRYYIDMFLYVIDLALPEDLYDLVHTIIGINLYREDNLLTVVEANSDVSIDLKTYISNLTFLQLGNLYYPFIKGASFESLEDKINNIISPSTLVMLERFTSKGLVEDLTERVLKYNNKLEEPIDYDKIKIGVLSKGGLRKSWNLANYLNLEYGLHAYSIRDTRYADAFDVIISDIFIPKVETEVLYANSFLDGKYVYSRLSKIINGHES